MCIRARHRPPGGGQGGNISGSHSHRDSFSLRVQLGGSCLSADSRDSVGLSGLARARTGPRAPRRAWETQEGGVKILGKPLASHSSPHPSDPGRLPRDSLLYHFGSKIATSNGKKMSSLAACKRTGWFQAGLERAVGGQPLLPLGPLSITSLRSPQIPHHLILGILGLLTLVLRSSTDFSAI